jgi:hypothetical protein
VRVRSGITQGGFGFLLLERQVDGAWSGTLYDAAGAILRHCRLADRGIACGS